jgi:thiol-disulfide isomerase/thioredoxin
MSRRPATRSPATRSPASRSQAARRTNRTWITIGAIAVVVVIAVVVAVASSGGGSGGNANAVQQAPVRVDGTPLAAYPDSGTDKAIGSTMPTLHGRSLFDGSPLTIAPTGKPQMISFLAHWCPHCQFEVPVVVALGKQGKLDGVDVRGVATGTRSDLPNYPPSKWLEGAGWKFPTMADSHAYDAANAYGLGGYPLLVFVDAQGKVVGRSEGEISPSALVSVLDALKAGKPLPLPTAGASSSAK